MVIKKEKEDNKGSPSDDMVDCSEPIDAAFEEEHLRV